MGFTLSWKAVTGEYRVNIVHGTEASAYYTDDVDDAMATGQAMVKVRNLPITRANQPLTVLTRIYSAVFTNDGIRPVSMTQAEANAYISNLSKVFEDNPSWPVDRLVTEVK